MLQHEPELFAQLRSRLFSREHDTRGLLIDGTLDAVLMQHPQNMVMNCVRIFGNLHARRDALAGVEALRISVILHENLP